MIAILLFFKGFNVFCSGIGQQGWLTEECAG